MLRAGALAALLFAFLPIIPAMAEQGQSGDAPAAAADTPSAAATEAGSDAAKAEASAEPAAKPAPPLRPTLTASIDLKTQRMTVKVDGETRYSWPISSGVAAYATPTGTFRPQWTAKMWYSRKYDMSPMPHAVFIHGGVAVHGTQYVRSLGRPASHGCIRLAPSNAATFYNLVQRHGLARTRVSVHGRPDWRGSGAIARRDENRKSRYADSGSSWFWGDSGYDSAYDSGVTRKKARKGYAYVDGRLMKVYRRANGQYVYRPAPRQAYSNYASDY
jgi:lipoprotein-anchoring transpeptidase ErfK/SrfK